MVDGIPVIDKSKLEKLLAKVAKEFTKKGCPIKSDDIFVPWDESIGKSKGCAAIALCWKAAQIFSRFAFIDFRSADDANLALVTMHNHPFDAKHSFKVNKFADIERYANLEETYVPPETEEYAPRVCRCTQSLVYSLTVTQEHLRAWLADPQGRDQYVTFRGDEVEIWWHGKPSQCEVAHTPVCFAYTSFCLVDQRYHQVLERFFLRRVVSTWDLHRNHSPTGSTALGWTVF